jgi:hypothetical protein
VDKDALFSNDPVLEDHLDSIYGSTFRIGAYTFGFTREIDLFPHIETGIGANFTASRYSRSRVAKQSATIGSSEPIDRCTSGQDLRFAIPSEAAKHYAVSS